MALAIDVEFKGMTAPNAYVTVAAPAISQDKEAITFSVWFRASPAHEVFEWRSFSAPYQLEGENPFVQAYEHLKTLPEFEGCVDC